jgi:hypothetical protein
LRFTPSDQPDFSFPKKNKTAKKSIVFIYTLTSNFICIKIIFFKTLKNILLYKCKNFPLGFMTRLIVWLTISCREAAKAKTFTSPRRHRGVYPLGANPPFEAKAKRRFG